MLSPEIIKEIRHVELKAGHLATQVLAGEYLSIFRGLGQEFEKVREYLAGDDIRSIDWNVTARMNEPYVKVYREERELTLMLLVDVSFSQAFGTEDRFKREVATELAAVLAFLATKNNDKVGLILFSSEIEAYIPPQKGRAHVWRIIRTVLTHETQGRGTNVAEALEYLSKVCTKKSMAFLISDFRAESYTKALNMASRRHNLIGAVIDDPREHELPNCGLLELYDVETRQTQIVDTSSKKLRQEYAKVMAMQRRELQETFKRYGVDLFSLTTKGSVVRPLLQYLRKRERRLG